MLKKYAVCFVAVSLLAGHAVGADAADSAGVEFTVMTFNILQGGNPANEIGSSSPLYQLPRHADIAQVILDSGADIVGVQEDNGGTAILSLLQAEDAAWSRRGNVYSRFPITAPTANPNDSAVQQVEVAPGKHILIHNFHWTASNYGPFLAQSRIIAGQTVTEEWLLGASDKGQAYQSTLSRVSNYMQAGEAVILTADFNEPSHLDWTSNYANNGTDRWVNNATATPLRFDVEWRGSKLLADAGIHDAYRAAFPNEVAHPGNTWTPPYANGTPGRRPYDADPGTGYGDIPTNQVLDRIDRVLYSGEQLHLVSAATVGESAEFADWVYDGPWPSDHRAVMATFRLVANVPGDLNGDGLLDIDDWRDCFLAHHGSVFIGLTTAETYSLGDLDGDLDNDIDDFLLLSSYFEQYSGISLYEESTVVFEPTTSAHLLLSCSVLAVRRLREIAKRQVDGECFSLLLQ